MNKRNLFTVCILAVSLLFPGPLSAQWEWENPLPQGSTFNDAWGPSAADIFIVGNGGAIYRFDGSTLVKMNSGTTVDLNAVWGTSASDVFAVGGFGTVLHYDGTSWSGMDPGIPNVLSGVSGSSGSSVYVVGSGGKGSYYNGSGWTTFDINGTSSQNHNDVWVSGSFAFSVGGAGEVYYTDGVDPTVWTEITNPLVNTLNTVSGRTVGSFSVFVGGAGGELYECRSCNDPGKQQWISYTSGTTQSINSLRSETGTDFYAACAGGEIWNFFFGASAYTNTQLNSGISGDLFGIFVNSGSGVAVGSGGITLSYSDPSWSQESSSVTYENLNGIWVGSSGEAYAVGDWRTVLHYDGTSWSEISSGLQYNLTGVWGAPSGNIYAVGDEINGPSGIIMTYDGSTWSTETAATDLKSVWGVSDSDIFAVGNNGLILHKSGGSWTQMTQSLAAGFIYDVWGVSPDGVFAVASQGKILFYNGSDWTLSHEMASPRNLRGVWGTSLCNVYAVGDMGTLLHYDGNSWSQIDTGTGFSGILYDIWGSSENEIFISASDGAVLKYNGTSWSVENAGTASYLKGISGGNGTVFVAGDGGVLLRSDAQPVTAGDSTGCSAGEDTGSSDDNTCAVVTAYNGKITKDVAALRIFRDRSMKKNPLGRFLVESYYRVSPAIAAFIKDKPVVKLLLRGGIGPVALAVGHPGISLVFISLIFCLFMGRRRPG